VLGQRAEDVWGVFRESMQSAVGMGVGMAPSHANAAQMAAACSIPVSADFWMLFGDIERMWVQKMNEKKPEE
jgi:hypothetical protein